jgi:hypothetical protein
MLEVFCKERPLGHESSVIISHMPLISPYAQTERNEAPMVTKKGCGLYNLPY